MAATSNSLLRLSCNNRCNLLYLVTRICFNRLRSVGLLPISGIPFVLNFCLVISSISFVRSIRPELTVAVTIMALTQTMLIAEIRRFCLFTIHLISRAYAALAIDFDFAGLA